MGAHDTMWHRIWCLSGAGQTTTIPAGTGSSGNWSAGTAPVEYPGPPALDLGEVTDVGLFVFTGAKTAAASLTVSLDLYDDAGNLYPAVVSTAAITASGAAAPVFAGLHGYGAGTYLVFPHYGRVSWALTGSGASFAGVEIVLYGR